MAEIACKRILLLKCTPVSDTGFHSLRQPGWFWLLFPQHTLQIQTAPLKRTVAWKWCIRKLKHKRWRAMTVCGMSDWNINSKSAIKCWSCTVLQGSYKLVYFFLSHLYCSATHQTLKYHYKEDEAVLWISGLWQTITQGIWCVFLYIMF